MINLFLIVHDFSGAKTYIDELSGYLVKNKEVSVFQLHLNNKSTKEFRVQENGKITSVYIPEKVSKEYDPKYYRRAAQLVFSYFKNLRNVIFHANMPEQQLFTKEAKELFNCPVVFTFHFLMSFYTFYDKLAGYDNAGKDKGNVLEKLMLESADHIICVTQFAQRAITNLFEIPESRTSVVYNGKSAPNKSPEKERNDKTFYGFSPDDRIILYAGQLEPRKGIDKLIEAFLIIKDRHPKTKLVIAGSGEFDNYLPLVRQCIGRIIFTSRLDKKSLSDFYGFSEVGIIPSQYEQCSYVAIEMMQHKLPLIISDVPGLNELVEHKKTGLVCKTNPHKTIPGCIEADETDLAYQIGYLLKNKKTAQKLAQSAHRVAIEKNSQENMGKSTISIYIKLLKENIGELRLG
jgi:glycosyltransferase involved in cell wall biosynthesis